MGRQLMGGLVVFMSYSGGPTVASVAVLRLAAARRLAAASRGAEAQPAAA